MPELQEEALKYMEEQKLDPENPDHQERAAKAVTEADAKLGDKSKFVKMIMEMYGLSTQDAMSFMSRANEPIWYWPANKETFRKVIRANLITSIRQGIRAFGRQELRFDIEMSEALVDVAYRIGTKPKYGLRGADNIAEVVLAKVKTDIQLFVERNASKAPMRFFISYNRDTNLATVFYVPADAADVVGVGGERVTVAIDNGKVPVGSIKISDTWVINGESANVAGDAPYLPGDTQIKRVRWYRAAASLTIGSLMLGSVASGTDPSNREGSVIDLSKLGDIKSIRTSWWQEPSTERWEYTTYTMLTRLAAVASEFVATGSLNPEGQFAVTQTKEELARAMDEMGKAAKAGGFVKGDGSPDLMRLFNFFDSNLANDAVFQLMGETDPTKPDQMEKLYTKLLERMQAVMKTMILFRGKTIKPWVAEGPGHFIDKLAGVLEKSEGKITPTELMNFFKANYRESFSKRFVNYLLNAMRLRRNIAAPVFSAEEIGQQTRSSSCQIILRRSYLTWLRNIRTKIWGRPSI